MKTYAALVASAVITMNSATAMKSYLEEIPNGSSFTQELGHPGMDSSKFTDFATAFGAASHAWSPEFCKETFPGATMTNGEAFGDPCCTWTKGGTPDFPVTAFTTTPGEATVCAAGGGSAPAEASSAATEPVDLAATKGGAAETEETPSDTMTTTEGSSPAELTTEVSSAETPPGGDLMSELTTEGSSAETPPELSAETPPAGEDPSLSGGFNLPPSGGGCAVKRARKLRQ